jgi:LysR family transcriptional regulator, transcriptional activator for dmlA
LFRVFWKSSEEFQTGQDNRRMSYLDNIRTFVRVFELGSMSAAARDQRISPAVASARITALEGHLGVRLFQRTTRKLNPTEQGRLYYDGAVRVLEAVDAAEAAVSNVTHLPRGSMLVAAPLGVGRRFIAPNLPPFKAAYPQIDVRLRLSDRRIDLTEEGIDVALFLGLPESSTLKLRKLAECPRVLCAAPSYIARHGDPADGEALVRDGHACLILRYPGAPEFQWQLSTPSGPRRYAVRGPFETDDGDVLTGWALDGQGIVMKPLFDVAEHLASGTLVEVAAATPPLPVTLGFLYGHRRLQDPKVRLFIEFMASRIKMALAGVAQLPR